MRVSVLYQDDTAEEFHCDNFGHTSHDNWIVLTKDSDPYVVLSRDNVKRITFLEEGELH